MRTTKQMSITLPHELAAMVSEKVASGDYASDSEVIRDGLRSLRERDRAVATWLQTVVAPTFDRVKSGEELTFSTTEARARLGL